MQRVGFLTILPGLLRRFGADPEAALVASGLEPGALDDPNATIPFLSMGRLLRTAAERTACPHLGLLIGKQITTASLGVVGDLMQTARTVGIALQDFAKHQHRNAHGSIAYLLNEGEHTIFGYTVYQPRMEALPHIFDGAAAAAFNILGQLRAPEAGPGAEILFARAQPADQSPYEMFFDAPLHFNAGQTGVRFPSAWLHLPVLSADPERRSLLETRVASNWLAGDLDILTRLRRLLRIALFSGQPSDAAIAAQLGMHQRRLHRLLAAEGLNFKSVLNELRFELAQQLLESTSLALRPIGEVLGFSHVNAFSRAFTRWSGVGPTEWRTSISGR